MDTTSKKLIIFLVFGAIIIFTLIFSENNSCAKSPVHLAVMDMATTNLTSSAAYQVSNKVRNAAVGKNGIMLVLGRQITDTLKKERISKSSASRNNSVAIRIGRAVGAHKVVTGLASRIGDLYVITLTLMDTNGGRSRQTTKNYRGSFDRFLSTSVRQAVKEVLNGVK